MTAKTISRLGQRRQVVIPKDICDTLHLDIGDFVAVEQRDNAVVIRPQAFVNRDDVLTAAEVRHVRQGARDARSGRVVGWERYKKSRALDRKSR